MTGCCPKADGEPKENPCPVGLLEPNIVGGGKSASRQLQLEIRIPDPTATLAPESLPHVSRAMDVDRLRRQVQEAKFTAFDDLLERIVKDPNYSAAAAAVAVLVILLTFGEWLPPALLG